MLMFSFICHCGDNWKWIEDESSDFTGLVKREGRLEKREQAWRAVGVRNFFYVKGSGLKENLQPITWSYVSRRYLGKRLSRAVSGKNVLFNRI